MAKKHIIEAPDGSRHIIEAPDDATPDQIEAFANQTFQPSQMESAVRGGIQGVTFGFGDEIFGAAKGVYDKVLGSGDFSGTYARERDAVRSANARAQEANPGTYLAGEIAGGIALPMGAAKVGYKGFQAANAGLKARSIAAAKEGAVFGGAFGFGKAEGDPIDQAMQTAGGAATGGAVGGVIPGAVQLGSAVLRTPMQAVRVASNPQRVAAEKVSEALARDAGSEVVPLRASTPVVNAVNKLQDAAARGDTQMMLADMGGENTRNLIKAATNMPNARAERFNHVLNRRQMAQPRALEDALTKRLAPGDEFYKNIDDIIEARNAQAQPLFARAFAVETPMTPKLARVLQRPTMVELQKHVQRRMADEDLPLGLMTRSEQLHRMKLELDEQIGMSKRAEQMGNRPTQGWDTRTLTILKNDLLNAIDNRAYKHALRQYAGPSALKNAAEDGFDEALSLPPERLRSKLLGLTDSEKQMWRQGAARALIDKVRTGNFMRDRTKSIFDTPDMRLRLKEIFPDNASRGAFLRDVAAQRQMSMTRAHAQGNSSTAKQLTNAQEAGKSIRTAADAAGAATGRMGSIMNLLERGANFASGITPGVAAEILDLGMQKGGGQAASQSTQAIQEAFARALARKARQSQVGTALARGQGALSSEFVSPLHGGIGPRYDDYGNLRQR